MVCTVGSSVMCPLCMCRTRVVHNRALELRAPTILRRILMRLRGVRILVPEGTLMCRTHTTQHELSAIAPNFVGGRKTLEARAVWVGLIRKQRLLI